MLSSLREIHTSYVCEMLKRTVFGYLVRPCSRPSFHLVKPVTTLSSSINQLSKTSFQRPRYSMMLDPNQFIRTSGKADPVWVHTEPYSKRPQFEKLDKDIKTDVCIIGSGISGISTAYELVTRGVNVVMIEARDILSGESGRTSGHLASALDDHYTQLAKTHGDKKAKLAAESHSWALDRVGEISKQLSIECEYRHLPGYEISQYPRSDPHHAEEMKELKSEAEKAKSLGLSTEFKETFAIKGWDGKVDQRGGAIFFQQATFHPTKYLLGVIKWLAKQPNFTCYTHTRMMSCEEKGLLHKEVKVSTLDGKTIICKDAVEATCVPLQKLSIVAELEYYRTYCIASRIPKGSYEDCLIYDLADPYHYIRFTECDEKDDYLVLGGADHKVGQEGNEEAKYQELEDWVRERFTQLGPTDYKWSGQIFEPVDYVAFIGLNQGKKHIYVVTGDSGNGLTHGVLAGKLIADEIQGVQNPWSELYNPKRLPPLSTLPDMIAHDLQINAQYKRFLQSDVKDIEDIKPCSGGVLNPTASKPIAVYRDENGKPHKFSAICPHLHGVVAWNQSEKTWDCPVHGSRFGGNNGVCVMGPAKAGLAPVE